MQKDLLFMPGLVVSLCLLSACASLSLGTEQPINIRTLPIAATSCTLKNDKGQWQLNTIPGSVKVHRSKKPLLITCYSPKYGTVKQTIESILLPTANNNLYFTGVIGYAVDEANNAAYDYPEHIKIHFA